MDAALNAQSIELLSLWLTEALAARQKILTAKTAVQIQNAGQMRIYNHGNVGLLNTYIADLQCAIASKSATAPRYSGPIYNGLGL